MPTLMQIDALLRRWIAVLAATFFAWRDSWHANRSLIITCENDQFIIRRAPAAHDGSIGLKQPDEQEQGAVLAVVAAGEDAPAELSQAARSGNVILEIPSENVVVRRIAVPVQAREFVAGIVSNQIERLSPWHSDQAIYAFAAEVNAEDAATLDVRVLIASRPVADAAREQIAAIGLPVDRVVASLGNAEGAEAITLWSRLTDISLEYQTRVRRHIGIGIAATFAASLLISAWALISAELVNGTSDDVAAQTDTLRHRLMAPLTLQSAASLPPKEREWFDKESSASAVLMIEALSRALPDTAYLTELNFESTTFRIVGLTRDAPSLIAPLEHSGSLTDVHFFAATTREADGAHFRFHIEGRVDPHVRLAER